MSRKSARIKHHPNDEMARREYEDGTIKKRFSLQDLKIFKARSDAQENVLDFYDKDMSIAMLGAAGGGKTAMALNLALQEVLDPDTDYEQVVVVRSPVQVRSLGFLPGGLDEKMMVYEAPYIGLCDEMFNVKKSYHNLKNSGKLCFMLTTFIRGITFPRGTIIIFDEVQNTTFEEAYSVITRMGAMNKIYLCGDLKQTDLKGKYDQSGLSDLIRVLERMEDVGVVNFTANDCVRSGFVREFLLTCEDLGL